LGIVPFGDVCISTFVSYMMLHLAGTGFDIISRFGVGITFGDDSHICASIYFGFWVRLGLEFARVGTSAWKFYHVFTYTLPHRSWPDWVMSMWTSHYTYAHSSPGNSQLVYISLG